MKSNTMQELLDGARGSMSALQIRETERLILYERLREEAAELSARTAADYRVDKQNGHFLIVRKEPMQ